MENSNNKYLDFSSYKFLCDDVFEFHEGLVIIYWATTCNILIHKFSIILLKSK
jgi:hypothetical protein